MATVIDTDFIEDLSSTSLLDEMNSQEEKELSSIEGELPLHDGLKNVEEDNPSNTLYMALESHLTDDYNEGRERYQGIIKDAMKAFEAALSMAVESGDPKSITALSSLMKTITDVTNKQLEFTMKYKNDVGGAIASTLDGVASSDGTVVTNQTNIQNNITVNTSSCETTEDFVASLIDESPSMEERFSSKKH